MDVVNNERESRFEVEVDGGSALARTGLDHARSEGLEVVATCDFISSYIDRHPEYQDLLAS